MRAMFLVVASVLLCVGLFGCDRQPQAPVAAPVVAAAPPCNCAPPAPSPPAPVTQVVHRAHHHHHAWSEHESSSYSSYGESGESYPASSESEEYSESSSASETQSAVPGAQAAWVDGYGRSHYAAGEQVDENPARLSHEDRRMRRDVWRGYDSKCAERDE
jgi:hypothetical protein